MPAVILFGMKAIVLELWETASIAVNNFSNYGEISITQFDVTVEGDFSNYGEIIASVFDVTVEGDFISDNDNVDFNLNGGSLVVSGNVFITADDFENNATIDIANDFNATVSRFYQPRSN